MWCLARHLPLLIGSLVPEENQYWENFLTLLSIIDYVFAPRITPTKVDYISATTEDFYKILLNYIQKDALHLRYTT